MSKDELIKSKLKLLQIAADAGRKCADSWCKNLSGDFSVIQDGLKELEQLLTQGVDGYKEALKPLADIPIEAFHKLAERPDNHVLMAWNDHKLTVGDVRRARAMLQAEGKG